MNRINLKNLESYIDHTNVRPEASKQDIIKLCEEAREFNFKSVCVNPCYVELAKNNLYDTNINICAVIGFPLGANATSIKIFEATNAVHDGANELDMVINIGAVKSGDWFFVKKDIRSVIRSVAGRALVKVIIETCLLTQEEKIKVCKCAVDSGADFIKTSTGYSIAGAVSEDIKLIRKIVKNKCKIKAAGGIKHIEEAIVMINSGADRLGTTNGARIMQVKKFNI